MDATPFTIIDDGRPLRVSARVADGRLRLASPEVHAALGVTTRAGEDEVDLEELAARLERPLALDVEERAAYLGVSARSRAAALASLEAPDFSLPDLDGRLHSLSEHRGKKVLLVAYASW
jgi:hypothetical protein